MGKIPDKIDKYRIDELIASGGMGEVYKGHHPTLNRPVILKKLTLRGNSTVTERFIREARIMLDFRNDNIVDVQDHFIQGRTHYIVMEYIDGLSVKELLDEQRYLDNATAAWIALHTAIALQYAHSKGVIHRDIKPGNILISKNGEIKLADFGIASAGKPDSGEDTLTADGITLGTPAYMAPEQFENSRSVDHRADLYSLGVMMYEMLTGLKPFPGSFTPETIRLIQKGKYKKPRRINPSISAALQRIIKSLIKPRQASRCSDIDTVIRKLEKRLGRYSSDQVRERLCMMLREETPPPLRLRRGRGRKLIIAACLSAAVAAGAAAGFLLLTGTGRRILAPEDFGQIRLNIDMPTEGLIRIPEVQLFRDDGADFPPAEAVLYLLPGSDRITSLPAALPPGSYRLKTTIGSGVFWTSFSLEPWKQNPETLELRISADSAGPGPLQVSVQVYDADTGWDLSDTAVLDVYRNGAFVPVIGANLVSGEVYNFRISAEGYREQEWVLRIKPLERILQFRTELKPEK